MFLKKDDKDITKEQFENIIKPRLDKLNNYVENILMPDYTAYSIATAYYDSSEWEESFQIHINSALTMFSCEVSDKKRLKKKVIELLKVKYSLKIIEESPILILEEIK